jgi:hypothetical protein
LSQPSTKPIIDVERLVADLRKRVAREVAAGGYADAAELAALGLEVPASAALAQGFDLAGPGTRIRFRPELGFSSKPVIGPVITAVKKLILRLLFFVLDDLARQADAAVKRLEAALAAEAAAREALEEQTSSSSERQQADVRALADRVAALESKLERP